MVTCDRCYIQMLSYSTAKYWADCSVNCTSFQPQTCPVEWLLGIYWVYLCNM